jgi:hypothetical protein
MDFYISRHAEKERLRREISSEQLEEVLQNPQQIVEDRGKEVYQSQMEFEDGKTYLVRAVVAKTKPAIVVTVYRTSRITKYWRPT